MTDMPLIAVDHLRVTLPGSGAPAIDDLSFTLSGGKTLVIIGDSSSGGSLVAPALTGLLPSTAVWSGSVNLHKADRTTVIRGTGGTSGKTDWSRIRGKIAYMTGRKPANALNPLMRVGKQLAETIAAHGGHNAASGAMEWLRKVRLPWPETLYHRYPHELSGGQLLRVMLALAMSTQPILLIADEPAMAMDVIGQRDLLNLMHDLQEKAGFAMIFMMQDTGLAARTGNDVLVMRGGQVIEYGPVETVLSMPRHPYTRALLACRPPAIGKRQQPPATDGFLNGAAAPEPRQPALIDREALLQVRHLRVWFPAETSLPGTPRQFLRAVEDISFDLHRGEILGLVGESGCGKSTVARALTGLEETESGQIMFAGKDLARMGAAAWRAMRRDIQLIVRNSFSSFSPRQTIGGALTDILLAHRIVQHRDADNEARRLLGLVKLPEAAMLHHPHQYNEGQWQRVALARALALRPQLIICDDILPALDTCEQAQMLNLLKDLQTKLRLSCLFISYDLPAVQYVADQVIVMQSGKIVERGSAGAVLQHPEHPYTQQLVAAI